MTKHVNMLLQKLRQAQNELRELDRRLKATKGDYDLGRGDPIIYEWEMTLARREEIEQRIKSIEEALERAKAGKYGFCEMCGRPIQMERLEILPFTTLCVECARKKKA